MLSFTINGTVIGYNAFAIEKPFPRVYHSMTITEGILGSAVVATFVREVWRWIRQKRSQHHAIDKIRLVDAQELRHELWQEIRSLREKVISQEGEIARLREAVRRCEEDRRLLTEHISLLKAERERLYRGSVSSLSGNPFRFED